MESFPSERTQLPWSVVRGLLAAAAIVVIVAGLRTVRGILVPVLIAVFVSVACAPALLWMRRRGVPSVVAVFVIVMVILTGGVALTLFLGDALSDFARRLPSYQAVLTERFGEAVAQLERFGVRLPDDNPDELLNVGAAFNWVALLFNSFLSLLTNGLLILLTVIFILLEAAGFEAKLRRALRNPDATLSRFAAFATGVKQYLVIKTAASALTGTLVAVWVAILGVEYPLLWGLLAFLLNFIPTIGSIVASIPPALLALVQTGLGQTALVLAGYLAVNFTIGNLLEPRWAGRGVGLSPLVVFLSVVFWGWVLGPMGLLLAAPLTMTIKLALEASPGTRWMAVLLGPEHAPDPAPELRRAARRTPHAEPADIP